MVSVAITTIQLAAYPAIEIARRI